MNDDDDYTEDEIDEIYEEEGHYVIDGGNDNPVETSMETRVQTLGEKKLQLLALLDSGAKSTYIKGSWLKNIPHDIEDVLVKVQGHYKSSMICKKATFYIKLPEFCRSKTVKVSALV